MLVPITSRASAFIYSNTNLLFVNYDAFADIEFHIMIDKRKT
jgi:hypothetical protein